MPLFPIEPPQGFELAKLKAVKANGSPFIINQHNPASVPVPVPVILADVVGKYTERDRKLFRFLVHAAWDELETKRRHSISMRDVTAVFEDLTGAKDHDWIKSSARRLFDMEVTYKITCGDPRFDVSPEEAGEGWTRFLSGVHFSPMGVMTYEIPAALIDIIKKPMRFARIRTHFVIGLSGKHTVTLYEILEAFANKDDPSFVVSVDELRQWLNLKPGQYDDWKDLKKRCLAPAIDQINKDPEGAGFSAEYVPVKNGKNITHLRFTMTKTQQRAMFDGSMTSAAEAARDRAANPGRPVLKAKTLTDAKRLYPRADIAQLERDWFALWARSSKPLKYPDAAFLGFAKKWAQRRELD